MTIDNVCFKKLKKLFCMEASILGPLHKCSGCVAWCFVGLQTAGIGGVSDSFAYSWDPLPLIGLPHPALM